MQCICSLRRVHASALVAAVFATMLLIPGPSGAVTVSREVFGGGNQGNPRVLPPQSNPYGHSYGEWSQKWWQWAYGLPATGHPLFDETGADCGAGQSGPVWFLGGVFNVTGTVVRTECFVPVGKALFFPIVNAEWDNFCPPGSMTPDELRATVKGFMDLATDLHVEVDGRALSGIDQYRFAPAEFGVDLPSGNIWEAFGCSTPAGHYEPLVPDGFYVLLSPLTPGRHTIHFKGTIGDPVNFTPEATYELTVLQGVQWITRGLPAAALEGTAPENGAVSTPHPTWGRLKTIYR